MLKYGCTRIEVGVQSIYEDIARDTNRGHTIEAVKKCFCLAKVYFTKIIIIGCWVQGRGSSNAGSAKYGY